MMSLIGSPPLIQTQNSIRPKNLRQTPKGRPSLLASLSEKRQHLLRAAQRSAEKLFQLRLENARQIAQFSTNLFDEIARLFIVEVTELMAFAAALPASQFVLSRSTIVPSEGAESVTEKKWLIESREEAVRRTKELWSDPYEMSASRLILRQGRKVLFRGHGIGKRSVLIDLVGCAHSEDQDQ
jgi:hypothetical protein